MAGPDDRRRPKYLQIADALKDAIRPGQYGPGD